MEKGLVIFEGQITALTKLCQIVGSDKVNGTELLNFIKRSAIVTGKDSRRIVAIPVISGNTIRSILRMHLAKLLLQATDGFKKLTESSDYETLLLLFQGGSGVEKTSDAQSQIVRELEQKKQTNMVLSLFGGSARGVMSPGKMIVEDGIPFCRETLESSIIPERIKIQKESNFMNLFSADLVFKEQYVRWDRFKDPEILMQLSPEILQEIDKEDKRLAEQKARESEKSENSGKKVKKEIVPRQMVMNFEVVAPGTEFYHSFTVKFPEDYEIGALICALREFAKFPYIGGLKSKGMGKVAFVYDVVSSEHGKLGTIYSKENFTIEVDGNLKQYMERFEEKLRQLKAEDLRV